MNRNVAIFALFMLSGLILSCTVNAQQSGGNAKQLSPGDHSLTLRVGDLERRYLLHVPTNYENQKPVPIVIMFHGGGGTGRGAMLMLSVRTENNQEMLAR